MTFKGFITRRAIDSVLLLIFTILFNFILFRIIPGDPSLVYVGRQNVDAETRARLIAEYGLDKHIIEQFFIYIQNLFNLDLSESITLYRGQEVSDIIFGYRLFNTIALMGVAILLSFVIAITLGTLAASKFKSKTDLSSILISLTAYSTPVFWVGMIVIFVFFTLLNGVLPLSGSPKLEDPKYNGEFLLWFIDYLYHMIGPVLTLTISFVGAWFLIAREQMLGIFTQDYITTARAKGLKERRILFVHARKNAMLPMVSVLALAMTYLVTGATLTETVFSWQGLGRLTYDAITTKDYPLLQGIFILVAAVTIVANFLADVIYGLLDPRIRY